MGPAAATASPGSGNGIPQRQRDPQRQRHPPAARTYPDPSERVSWKKVRVSNLHVNRAQGSISMSQNRKILKVISLVQALVGLAAIIAGVLAIMNGQDDAGTFVVFGTTIDASLGAIIVGVLGIATGVLTFASCGLGIQGANRPSSLGAHAPASVGALVLGILTTIFGCSASLSLAIIAGIAAVLALFAVMYDGRVRKELDR